MMLELMLSVLRLRVNSSGGLFSDSLTFQVTLLTATPEIFQFVVMTSRVVDTAVLLEKLTRSRPTYSLL